jgi:hypothetical protein
MTEAAGASASAMKEAFDISLKAAKQIGALNSDFAHSLIAGPQAARTLDLHEQMQAYSRRVEHSSEHFRNINDILLKTQSELAKLNAQNMSKVLQTLASQLEHGNPIGGIEASKLTDLMRASFVSAGNAYETMFKMTNTLMDTSIKTIAPTTTTTGPRSHSAGTERRKSA